MKKGFTLVELLVVVGILGTLIGVLAFSFTGAKEQAEGAVCLTRMRNLAQACNSMSRFPLAGSAEYIDLDSDGNSVYGLRSGWIGNKKDYAYRGTYGAHAGDNAPVSCYSKDEEDYMAAITNGTMFAACSDLDTYVCPMHAKEAAVRRARVTPRWSYAMNSHFGYDESEGKDSTLDKTFYGVEKSAIADPAHCLLFAEIPYTARQGAKFSSSASTENDGVLQYRNELWQGTPEAIGVNHRNGRDYYAHVVFANMKAKALPIPSGMSNEELLKLTEWLCKGYATVQVGEKYELADESVEN